MSEALSFRHPSFLAQKKSLRRNLTKIARCELQNQPENCASGEIIKELSAAEWKDGKLRIESSSAPGRRSTIRRRETQLCTLGMQSQHRCITPD